MKTQLRQWLQTRHIEAIAEACASRKRLLNTLFSLTYDDSALIVQRALEALGPAARRIVAENPVFVRAFLQRMLWLLNEESGGIGWRAPEALGEVVHACPEHFADFAPLIVNLLSDMADEDLERFRPGLLRAVGRIAPDFPSEARRAAPALLQAAVYADPQTRAMAAWALGRIRAPGAPEVLRRLANDSDSVWLYRHGEMVELSISQIARESRKAAMAAETNSHGIL